MFALALFACIQPEPTPEAATPATTAAPDLEEPVSFEPGAMLEVEVTMDDADFETLRNETRNAFEMLQGDCLTEPFGSPFTWFSADVSIDGRELADVGIRKKGLLGSLTEDRPSLKLKLDKFVDGQKLGGTERVTLNNQLSDPAKIRNCLAYEIFAAAGNPTPRCNFAHVQVNGEDLGVYVHIEAVKTDFLDREFGESDGHLYEGTLSDFREGHVATFDPKTDTTDPTGEPLQGLVDALARPDDELFDALEPVLDLDAYIQFWASEQLIAHWDGYAMNRNNFYVYIGADGLVRFIPWGADAVMYGFEEESQMPVMLAGELARRLYAMPAGRNAFRTEIQRQLDEVFDEDALQATIDSWEHTLSGAVLDRPGFRQELDTLRGFVDGHRSWVQATLDNMPPPVTEAQEPLCFEAIGTASWTFGTSFSDDFSIPSYDDPVTLVLEGTEYVFTDTYSVAGYAEDGEPVVATIGTAAPGITGQILLSTPGLAAGDVEIDFATAVGYIILVDAETEELLLEGVISGLAELDEGGTAYGNAVSGSLEGEVFAL